MYFDFNPFGIETKVSLLADLLSTLETVDCEGFDGPHVLPTVCRDIVNGLQYLHQRDVAHRDLKPANVLISNRHYCDLEEQDMLKAWKQCPLICKLADFGESRSNEFQTGSILKSQTKRVGTTRFIIHRPYSDLSM